MSDPSIKLHQDLELCIGIRAYGSGIKFYYPEKTSKEIECEVTRD